MQIHQIKPFHKQRLKKRVGRGGKRGFYSGRGAKGQTSRSGKKFEPLIRQLIKRYPKLRGYRFKAREKPTILNVKDLEKKFQDGETVSPKILFEKRLLRRIKGKITKVKILGKGEITKSLIIENCQVSNSARKKIEKARGKIE